MVKRRPSISIDLPSVEEGEDGIFKIIILIFLSIYVLQ